MNRPHHLLALAVILATAVSEPAGAEELSPEARTAIGQWLQFQSGVLTVEAEFVQIRELRTLRNGLRTEGTIWIDRRGARFRWQAGDSANPKSVAIKNGDTLTLLQPARKRARQLSVAAGARSGGGSAEAAFDFATGDLPGTIEGLTRQFAILEAKSGDGAWRIRLEPKDHRLREAVTEVVFRVDAAGHHLRGFDLTFRDGSAIRTTFVRQRFNGPLADSLFQPDLAGYEIERVP